jgi:3-isopropylmalate/(R)-2-methylmalate dehydratase small subunit
MSLSTPFSVLEGVAAPLMRANVDTDCIIRIEHLAAHPRGALGPYALWTLRKQADGTPDPACILNQPPFDAAQILLADENFGCGSSRENAVWALADAGYRAFIAPSYGEIFRNNCFQNGLLPIVLPREQVLALAATLSPQSPRLRIELQAQTIVSDKLGAIRFEIDAWRKALLQSGQDAIEATRARLVEIEAFEKQDQVKRPWLYPTA